MPPTDSIDALWGKAEEMLDLALGAIHDTRGSERGVLYATIANLYIDMMRFRHEVYDTEREVKARQNLRDRLKRVESRLSIHDYPETPDPFADVPIEERTEPDLGDEGFDRPKIKTWERDISTGGI